MGAMQTLGVRPADANDLEAIARLWFDGWHEAHDLLAPEELVVARTFESFLKRAQDNQADMLTGLVDGQIGGMCQIKDNELYQLYVARFARGSGLSQELMQGAEAKLTMAGVGRAWLACAVGNDRAAHFYESCGWTRVGAVTVDLEVIGGKIPMVVWRYEKELPA
jgi:GNAT superfamily N-acetyltransferase